MWNVGGLAAALETRQLCEFLVAVEDFRREFKLLQASRAWS